MDQDGEKSAITFEEEEFPRSAHVQQNQTPAMTAWVIAHSGGKISTETEANYVLIGIAVIAFTISLLLNFGGAIVHSRTTKPQIYQEDLTPTDRATIPKQVLDSIPYRHAK